MKMKSKKIVSSKDKIEEFLVDLKNVLLSENFNIDTDLDILDKKKDELKTDPHTTANTILALEFDREDVKNELLNLTTSDYYETLLII